MKRSLILAIGAGGLLLVLFLLSPRERGNSGKQSAPEAAPVQPAVNTPPKEPGVSTEPGPGSSDAAHLIRGSQQEMLVRSFNSMANTAVAFCGQVVDQDSNPLQDVQVAVMVSEEHMMPSLQTRPGNATNLSQRTGPDGRFEVTGLKGNRVSITALTKEGYEPEQGLSEIYGVYEAQSGSFTDPVVFRMWPTNMHEHLISGDRELKIVPDGRHYGIDLSNGTAVEGDDGDLVVWIKCREGVDSSEKLAWSCGLIVPGGGLQPESIRGSPMYRAPLGEYTNALNIDVNYNSQTRDGMSLDNRCYFRLRNGLYGRVTASFWTTYHYWAPTYRKDPSFGQIRLSYAVNPSGSRLLR